MNVKHFPRTLLVAFLMLAGFALIPEALAEVRSNNLYWAPPNATEGGKQTDAILEVIFYLTATVFILVQAVFIYYLVRYRRRPGVKAHYSHGNNALEIIWTALPTVIFLALAIWSNRVWEDLTSRPVPADAVVVEVVGYQFAWDLRYAGEDGILDDTALEKVGPANRYGLIREDPDLTDDFTSTEMVIPMGRPVHVLLRSRDVIHSFYVPEFRLYQDAVPGRTIDWMWFTTIRTGNFELACSQLCGSGHYNMKAPIRVVPQKEFDEWQAKKIEARKGQIAAIQAARSEKPVAAR